MKFLASATCEEALSYKGKLVIPNEEEGKKPHQVLLNIVAEDESVFSELSCPVQSITFMGNPPSFVPTNYENKVFCETSLEGIKNISFPSKVIPLVRLEPDFSDMRAIYNCSKEYPTARFIGGNILGIPDLKIGRFDSTHKPIVCHGVYDDFIEVQLSELDNLQEVVKKVKIKVVDGEEVVSKRRKGDKKPKAKKASKGNKVNKKVAVFSSLFGSETVEF